MTIKGLELLKEKYIIFLLEDYFISKSISNSEILDIVHVMDQENIFYYRLTSPLTFTSGMSNVQVPENTPYPISLQPAVWNREVFLGFLKQLQANGCKTPWDFERYFIEKYKDGKKDVFIEGIRYDSRDLIGYKNGIIQGKWDPRVVRYYKNQGITIDFRERGLMPRKKVFLDGIKRNKIIRSMSYSNQKRIKNFFRKLGIKFMTE